MMTTLGIDPATHTGLALVGAGDARGKVIEFKKLRGFQRLQLLAREFERTMDLWSPDLAVIERYAPNPRNMKTIIVQVECGTVIKEVLYRHGIQWVEIDPCTLKKWTTGKGNADKDAMAVAVEQRWGYKSPSHDIVDAMALAHMGQLGLVELAKLDGIDIIARAA